MVSVEEREKDSRLNEKGYGAQVRVGQVRGGPLGRTAPA